MCPTNVYFDNFTSANEQRLYEDIVMESIQIHGLDVSYCPRTLNNYDPIYGADTSSSYNSSYQIEMYIKDVDGFTGDKNIFTLAGLEIKDRIVFVVSRTRFNNIIGIKTNLQRPLEGDLVYFPLYGAAFQIKYVENRPYFYQFGDLPTYELQCELWDYSGESLHTGVPALDNLAVTSSTNLLTHGLLTDQYWSIITSDGSILEESSFSNIDIIDDSNAIQIESDGILEWDRSDAFSTNFA